jgi:tetratricopeptide (TPR) repeat protein
VGNGSLTEAGHQMLVFLKQHPKSYHYYQANELVGNLLVAAGASDKAEPYYALLAKAPWPDYQMRAKVAMGRGLLAQGKMAEADKMFDEVLENTSTSDLAEGQRMMAKVGKARCMVAAGKAPAAVKVLQEIIASASADNVDLHALAYNALGTALRKQEKPMEALLAFLHVDLLYSNNPEADAEALANLEQLFNEIHKPEKARRIRAMLDDRYKNSRWAKMK